MTGGSRLGCGAVAALSLALVVAGFADRVQWLVLLGGLGLFVALVVALADAAHHVTYPVGTLELAPSPPTPMREGPPAVVEALTARLREPRVRDLEGGAVVVEGLLRGERVQVTLDPPLFKSAACAVACEVPPERTGQVEGEPAAAPHALRERLVGPAATAVAWLLQASRSVDVGPLRVEAHTSPAAAGQLLRTLEALADVARAVRSDPAPAGDEPQVEVRAAAGRAPGRGDAGAPRCPYCHADVDEVEAAACEACRTVHHAACFEEHGRCTVPGCASTRATARPGRARRAEGAP